METYCRKRTFTIVVNAVPLTRITTTAEVPLRKPTALESDTPKPVVTLVYSRKPKKSKTNVPVSKPKNIKSLSANKKGTSVLFVNYVIRVPESVDQLYWFSRQTICILCALGDMMAFFPICPLVKGSKTKSWLWHQQNDSEASSSSDVIPTVVHTATSLLRTCYQLDQDHPLDNTSYNFKMIYKVKLDELGGISKEQGLDGIARGYHQEEGIDFESP
ncbi:hypothetical protein Tco_0735172 [Tanacetum coccineum]